MRILFVASMYPHPGLPYSGIFIRNCVVAVKELGHDVVGLVPRPYFPVLQSLHPRLASYAQIPKYSEADGIPVHRPNLFQVPYLKVDWQQHQGAFLQMKRTAQQLHEKHKFSAILSFNLLSGGGLAWRLGRLLDIPATGWGFGTDVRVKKKTDAATSLRETVENLDWIFYQSSELRDCALSYLDLRPHNGHHVDTNKHVVLPHGIPPLQPAAADVGPKIREEHGIPKTATLALFLSRVVKGKGIFDLVEAFRIAKDKCPTLWCLAVGESPGFDDSESLRSEITKNNLADQFILVPACKPDEVRNYQAAADIFAFPSHNEGMPNALLEAMAVGTPSIAFDIPPIMDIQAHDDCLSVVPLRNAAAFGKALVDLAESPERRRAQAERAEIVVREHFDVRTNIEIAIAQMPKADTS